MARESDIPPGSLSADHALLHDVIERLPLGLSVFDRDDRLVLSNGRYAELWGLPPALVRPGTPFATIMQHTRGQETDASRLQPPPAPGTEGTRSREWQLDDGRFVQVEVSRRTDGSCVALHQDVTAIRQAHARIGHQARHDTLTGLANRASFVESLDQAVRQHGPDRELAVLCLDLDRFKPVNDAFGHARGDELLCQVAQRLRACVRERDLVGRIGGDEFVVAQLSGGQPRAASALARRLIDALALPFDLDGHRVHIGCSIGVAVMPFDGQDAASLIHHADLALLGAKADGRGAHRFFEPRLEAAQQARRTLEADLRRALAEDGFDLVYQPQVDVDRRTVTGVEALLRWHHPQRGPVSPAEFVPIAEETGLIVPLGAWVLHRACRDALHWPMRVAVNVSVAQFRRGQLLADVWSALSASGLPPDRLEIEITESVMLRDPEQVLQTLNTLRERGVRIAMDDFGTGYSSLSTLRQFRFDRLKIDRSFVRDAETRADTRAIIGAVVQLGRQLGMATTVEGVETTEQLSVVSAQGCHEVQGYLFSRPRPATEIPAFLETLQAAPRTAACPGEPACSNASST